MPKYYVQSGNLKLLTTASDSRAAAIWAVHRTLSPALPFLGEEPAAGASPPARLAETIRVNQRGFDRPDNQVFDTLAVVSEWTQLLLAVDRLERRLATAVAPV
ncbi:MAG: hypothetical protein WD872_16280 [Pirellulaceae bacterium]